MKTLLKYLVVYACLFGFWTWFTWGQADPGYERLHWFAIFTVSLLSLLPVALGDAVSTAIRENKD